MARSWGILASPARHILSGVADTLVPQTCLACGDWIAAGTGPVCGRCDAEISDLRAGGRCPRCGRTMAAASIHERGCARCLHEAFWNVAAVARIGAYAGPLVPLITGLKYRGHERNAEFAGRLLAEAVRGGAWADKLDALVPVPMSRLRRVQRPCDHAALVAAVLGRELGVPVVKAVRRLKHTPSQTRQTSRHSRFENIKGCFGEVAGRVQCVTGKTVCIVDNLLTSGATLCEMSKVLRRAGARKIYAAVIARTMLPGDPAAGAFAASAGRA